MISAFHVVPSFPAWISRPRLGFLVAAALSLGSLVPIHAYAAPALSSLNVQQSDLPAGSVKKLDQTLNAAQLAVVEHVSSPTTFSKLGLRQSSDRVFDFTVKGETTAELDSAVESFAAPAQAHARFQNLVSLSKAALPGRPARTPAVHVGDEEWVAAVTDTGTADSPPAISFVEFRRGRYTVVIYVSGNSLAFTTAEAISVAGHVDARVRAAR